MQNNNLRIESLINKKGDDNVVMNMVYNLMTNCYQQYSEIMQMPVPIALKLLKIIEQEHKKMEKKKK
jgi:hypothetical protein